ncbi:MAG: head-tail adaptor protein [Aquamicrobium sp.]|uniref:head-tail adaptor protein n=1 Tax=Aquamicrobium sp. TaxID=1872579 RepID=UPI00349EB65C|nr:head-tail adaptor protein [Aquamicrobium sp.]
MRERIGFQESEWVDDGWGGSESAWVTKFEEPAELRPGIGSETVIASRIAGVQPFTMVIRSSTRTRQITPAWRCYDVRAGMGEDGKTPKRLFNIKAVANPDQWHSMLNLMVVEGTP